MMYLFGDCELDTELHELRRTGKVVPVQPQVFELLRYLIDNSHRAVTKSELFEHVWHGRIVSETTLTSRIKSARQVVGDDGRSQSIIKTLHGRGFRFVASISKRERCIGTEPEEADPSENRKPSLAVLPFRYLSDDLSHAYLADGIADEVTWLLSRLRWLRVISRHTSFAFRERIGNVRKSIGDKLDVRYVLDGTVQREGNRIRVGAHLVRMVDEAQIWSEYYDRRFSNLLDVQDEIAMAIVGALDPELTGAEQDLVRRKSTDNMTAWQCYVRGRERLFEFTERGFSDAEHLLKNAIALDPAFSQALASMAYLNIQRAFYGDPEKRDEALNLAVNLARSAVAIDEREAMGHFSLGRAYTLKHQFAEGEVELQKSIEINPSYAQAHFAMGFALTANKKAAEAISWFDKFFELSPWDAHSWTNYHMRGMANYWSGNLVEAERDVRRAISQPNVTRWPFATLVSILGTGNRQEEAEIALVELRRRVPQYSLATAHDDLFFLNDDVVKKLYLDGLRAAGIS